MSMTASEAANAIGLTRQGVIKAIKSGKISASKDHNGAWKIEPSELFRAYPPVNQNTATVAPQVEAGIQASLQAVERENELLRGQVNDLREERDEWRRQAQTLALTDQRVRETRKGIWARLLGRS